MEHSKKGFKKNVHAWGMAGILWLQNFLPISYLTEEGQLNHLQVLH